MPTLTVNIATLDRRSLQWGSESRRHVHRWSAGHQQGAIVVRVVGDCAMSWPTVEHDPGSPISPMEEAKVHAAVGSIRVTVTRSGDAPENARRAAYAHLCGRDTYRTVAGRIARVRTM